MCWMTCRAISTSQTLRDGDQATLRNLTRNLGINGVNVAGAAASEGAAEAAAEAPAAEVAGGVTVRRREAAAGDAAAAVDEAVAGADDAGSEAAAVAATAAAGEASGAAAAAGEAAGEASAAPGAAAAAAADETLSGEQDAASVPSTTVSVLRLDWDDFTPAVLADMQAQLVVGRGLHSFTSQLNLSLFGHTSPCPPV